MIAAEMQSQQMGLVVQHLVVQHLVVQYLVVQHLVVQHLVSQLGNSMEEEAFPGVCINV